jgi:thymidylate synthase ThyX
MIYALNSSTTQKENNITLNAKIIADSINTTHDRLTSIEVTMHRYVLSELNTHRLFSRNSASSRAIPVETQLNSVQNNTAYPISLPSEQPGMQGGSELEGEDRADALTFINEMVQTTNTIKRYIGNHPNKTTRLHKSVINRYLEPYSFHTVLISATNWQGFWEQRCNPNAQPEIRAVAELMRTAYNESTPKLLQENEWHLPYISQEEKQNHPVSLLGPVSVARCARLSYLTHGNHRPLTDDIDLYNKLISATPAHLSPLEHIATPDLSNYNITYIDGTDFDNKPFERQRITARYGNMIGWQQHRVMMETEWK